MKIHVLKLFTSILLLISAISVNGQIKKTASVEGITEYKLDNGLKVLLFQDNSAQTITVNITYLVGSRHEGYGEKGMAHLLEHMVFKGTPNHKDIPKELSSHGARPNGTTWYDRTNYFETFNATPENLDWALDLEADRMLNSFIAKEDLESEFSVVRNEFESGENSPTRVLMQKVIDAGYLWHNYGNSTIGNRSDIERVPIENLKAFYKNFYRPDNAILMVTGKFEEESMLELVVKKFGNLKNPSTPIRDSYTEEPAQDGEKFVNVSRVGDLKIVSAMYHTPAGSHEDYAALAVLEDVLTNQPSGRLYKKLIDTQKASSLWSFSPFTKEPGFMYINVDVPSKNDSDEVEGILRNALDNLEPLTKEELERGKANILKQIDQISRNSAFLGTYMSEFIGAGDWRLSYIFRDRVEKMTLEQVDAAAKKYIISTNRTIGRFIPEKEPKRVSVEHTIGLDELVSSYVGKKSLGSGEAFDVSYDNIEKRLEKGTLSNGVEYGIVEKNNRGETIGVNFSMRNGNVKSLSNKGLIPSFTAQMLDKGTKSKTRQEIEDELSKLKSSVWFSARNGNLYTDITSTKADLMAVLKLAADMIKNPSFDQAELEKLKIERLADLESNKTQPRYLVSKRINRINNNYPKGHPAYAMSIEEEIEAINQVTIEDLVAFHKEFYGLGRSILVSVGSLNSADLKSFIEKEFGAFKSKRAYQEIEDPYIATKSVNEDIITPDKKNAVTFGSISIELSAYDADYPALRMASIILGEGFLNSRIADRLRQKDGISYGAGSRLNEDHNQKDRNSSMILYAIYAPANYDKIQLGFQEEIDRFIKDGITEEELKNAKNGWVEGQNVSRAKDGELTSTINNNIYYGRDMNFHKNIEKAVKELTVADVNKAIKKYIMAYNKWTVVNAGDFEK